LADQTINEIEFLFPLSEQLEDRLRVSALKRKGGIIKFVVQYEAYIENKLKISWRWYRMAYEKEMGK